MLAPKRSNLDLNGRLVKKGVVVSFHGFRYWVHKVNRGFCYCRHLTLWPSLGHYPPHPNVPVERYVCESVQVVQ
jgi:hypothetical protein